MLVIRENADEVVVRGQPFLKWLSAFVFTYILLLIAYLAMSFTVRDFSLTTLLIAAAVGLAGYLFFYSSITVKINRSGKTISVRRQSFIKYDFKVYSFKEVEAMIYVKESHGSHQLMLPLKDGRKIELSAAGPQGGQYYNAAQIMNEYIFDSPDQIPFRLAVFEDD